VTRGSSDREQALRVALEARLWEDRVESADPLESDPEEARRRRHDANNALSTALLSAQFLRASHSDAGGKPSSDLQLAAEELVDALLRLKRMIGNPRPAATTAGPRAPMISSVALLAGVTARAEHARARNPRVAIEVTPPGPPLEGARVAVCAGEDGLARVLDALLENACESGAKRVAILFGAEGEVDVVSVEITDDGPGFSAEQLAAPSRAFTTTKPGRLGLGLYAAERILFASGGSLRRENAPGGGARLTVYLQAATDSVTRASQ
jgi:signal transduction histidine kinase